MRWIAIAVLMLIIQTAPSRLHAQQLTDSSKFGWIDAFAVASGPTANLAGSVFVFAEYNGTLYAGGDFLIDGVLANLARWDGGAWSAEGLSTDGPVYSLVIYEGALVAGGAFDSAGGVSVKNVARWDGVVWQSLGAGLDAEVYDLEVHDGELYACGLFEVPWSDPGLAMWNGAEWIGFGVHDFATVYALLSYNSTLYAGGVVMNWSDGSWGGRLLRLEGGTEWRHLHADWDTGLFNGPIKNLSQVGSSLAIVGSFTSVDSIAAQHIALWEGASYAPLGAGTNGEILAIVDGLEGPMAAGAFSMAGSLTANNVARFGASGWEQLAGDGPLAVQAVTSFGGWTVTGSIDGIHWWDGSQWVQRSDSAHRSASLSGMPTCATTFGGELVVGGYGLIPVDDRPVQYGPYTASAYDVVAWDGATWQPLSGIPLSEVDAFVEFEGQLIAAGDLSATGEYVARWDGAHWSDMSDGLNGLVRTLAVHDGMLYAGGDFTLPSQWAVQWNGTAWEGMPGDVLNSPVYALASHNGQLYAGGRFSRRLVYHDGSEWVDAGGEIIHRLGASQAVVRCLFSSGANLYVGGSFDGFVKRLSSSGVEALSDRQPGYSGFLAVDQEGVYDLALLSNELVATGVFEQLDDDITPGIARYGTLGWRGFDGGIAGGDRFSFPRGTSDEWVGPGGYGLHNLSEFELLVFGSFNQTGSLSAEHFGVWRDLPPSPTGAEPAPALIRDGVQARPNPFNSAVTIMFSVSGHGQVGLDIVDVRGRLVRRLYSQRPGPGNYEMTWDGRDDDGVPVASGTYLARLITPKGITATKVALVK